jgi:hypothetical protein
MKNKEISLRRPQHIVAKIVCLILAVVLWLYVMYVEAPVYSEVYEGVRVTVNGDATEWRIDDPTLSIRVYGTKMELAAYSATDVVAYILPSDLPDATPMGTDAEGYQMYSFDVRVKLPGALSLEDEYFVVVRHVPKGAVS